MVNMLKDPKNLLNLHESTFMNLSCHCKGNLSGKPLLLVIFELLRLFVETMTADDKYSLCNIWKFPGLIKMRFPKNLKYFVHFFLNFRNLNQIANILKKEMTLIPYLFRKLQTLKDMVRQMLK